MNKKRKEGKEEITKGVEIALEKWVVKWCIEKNSNFIMLTCVFVFKDKCRFKIKSNWRRKKKLFNVTRVCSKML